MIKRPRIMREHHLYLLHIDIIDHIIISKMMERRDRAEERKEDGDERANGK